MTNKTPNEPRMQLLWSLSEARRKAQLQYLKKLEYLLVLEDQLKEKEKV